MSLLLDALRKAEQERTLGQPPTPGAVATGVGAPTTTADTRPSGRFRTIIVLLFLIFVCLLVAGSDWVASWGLQQIMR